MKRKFLIGFLAAIILISLFGLLIWNTRKDMGPVCGNEICEIGESYPECAECPDCDDKDNCTEDSFDYQQHKCLNKKISPCCGDGICETRTYSIRSGNETSISEPGETYLTCPQDCPSPQDILEEKIFEIKDYPKLGQVFIDLYADEGYVDSGFSENETYFMKVGLEIYKEKPELKEYPKEALIYLMSRSGGWNFYDVEFFNQSLIPLAKEITAGTKDDSAAVKAIYLWVKEIMIYGYFHHGYITPQNILREKRGICGEYAVLIAALCKATGIPARVVHSVEILPSGLAHAWVEVYINGDWVPIPSTGALDYDNDGMIEYSDLVKSENNRMIETFIESPYHTMYSRTDITFGYNNYIAQQMITEVQDMLEENYNLEAKENLNSAKNKLSLWEKEKSTEDRNRIGREAMEYLLRAMAILKENITGDEVYVAFLEDFPIVNHWYSDGKMTTRVYRGDIIESADIKNPLAFWEDFQETLNETNPKILYLFDATDEGARIDFGKCHGIDFCMIRTIDELIKNEGLDTELNFVLYRSNDLEKIEFLEYEDIEPVITLNKLFLDLDNALDLMLNLNEAINNVKDNVTEMSFYLPPKFEERYTYYIGAIGPFLKEGKEYSGGFSLRFSMVVKTSIGELPIILEVHTSFPEYPNPEYTNLIIVDESGNVTRPEEKNGKYYYSVCPSGFVHLNPGQNLIIEREGDFIKITETGKA